MKDYFDFIAILAILGGTELRTKFSLQIFGLCNYGHYRLI